MDPILSTSVISREESATTSKRSCILLDILRRQFAPITIFMRKQKLRQYMP